MEDNFYDFEAPYKWAIIQEFPDYAVSEIGEIFSFKRDKLLIPSVNRKGYSHVTLLHKGRRKSIENHRLVAGAFIQKDNLFQIHVDHIDTDKENNSIENLKWCTIRENNNNPLTRQHNSSAQKGKRVGEKNPMFGKSGINSPTFGRRGKSCEKSKPVLQFSLNGTFIKEWECMKEVERSLSISSALISCVCRGKIKAAGGFTWKFK